MVRAQVGWGCWSETGPQVGGSGLPQWTEGWSDSVSGCKEQGWGPGREERRGKRGDSNEAVEGIPGER